MKPLDDVAPNFRRATTRWPGAMNLAAHYAGLVAAYETNGTSLVELAKSFLESVCKTVMVDSGKQPESPTTTTSLLKEAAEAVGLAHSRGASSFNKVLSAYFKLADALNELRNAEGTVAHGKDGFVDPLCPNHTRIYLVTADAVIALLLDALDRVEPDLLHTRRSFESFEHFNRSIDAAVSCFVEVEPPNEDDGEGESLVVKFMTTALTEGVSLILRPSELLYAHDRNAYIEVLHAVQPIVISLQHKKEDEDDA